MQGRVGRLPLYCLTGNLLLLPHQTTYKIMKKSFLSLTALLLSLTALLLSAMLLASCENKAEQGASPEVYLGKAEAFNSLPHPYDTTLDDFTPNQVN